MDATTKSSTIATTNTKVFNPVVHMEPLACAHEGLLAFALHGQAPPLAWTHHDNDRFEAMMLEPPTDHGMKKEPPHLALRISLPANGEARGAGDAMPSPTPSTILGVTSGEDNDEDDALELKKRERRRIQVRKASSRRRLKLKAEGEFRDKRMKQLEAHMALLRKRFPHAMHPPPPRL